MSEKQIIDVPGVSGKIDVPLSWAVKANGFVFVSGIPPVDHRTGILVQGDIEFQTRTVMETVKYVLESAGSSLDKVVKATVFITNAAYFKKVNAIYREYFQKELPARTFVAMASWPLEFDIEIEVIALA